jgi:predicted ATP-dependent serine protease
MTSKASTRFDLLRKAPAASAAAGERLDQFVTGEEATTQISIRLPKLLVRALKIHMAQTEQTQQTIVQRLLETYLREQGVV